MVATIYSKTDANPCRVKLGIGLFLAELYNNTARLKIICSPDILFFQGNTMADQDKAKKDFWESHGCLITVLVFVFGILFCTTSVYVITDEACQNTASRWLPDYPNSQVTQEEHSWIRPFGIGVTTRILYTTDRRVDVIRWYADYETALSQQGHTRDRGAAVLSHWIHDAPNGEGTIIEMHSQCNPEMALWGN